MPIYEVTKEVYDLAKKIAEGKTDYAPVVRGKWEKNCDVAFFWKCSECGCYLFWRKEEYLLRNEDEPNYCPNCGARMDGDGDV